MEYLNRVGLSHFKFGVSGEEERTCEVVSVHPIEEHEAHEGHEAQAGHDQPNHQEAVAALGLYNLWGVGYMETFKPPDVAYLFQRIYPSI